MDEKAGYIIIDRSMRLDAYYSDIEKIYISNGWGSKYSTSTLQKMFGGCYYLVALKENSAVGLARVFTDDISVSHLSEIVVYKSCQRMGVGEALMEKLVRDLGHTTIYADVLGSQSPELFKKFGLVAKPKFTVYARRATS